MLAVASAVKAVLDVLLKPAVVAAALGAVIPLLTALGASKKASGLERSLVVVVVAAGGTVVAWVAQKPLGVSLDPTQLGFVALGGLVAASLHRWTWLQPFEALILKLFPKGFGGVLKDPKP